MDERHLDLLRCPFCGTGLSLADNAALRRNGSRIDAGVLGCECCAFPIVEGIPVMVADDTSREAIDALEAGHYERALFGVLGLKDETRARTFRDLLIPSAKPTYRDMLEVLSLDAEGTYFVYRFSDPTYITADALLRAISQQHASTAGHWLDLCGGSGHLTRVLDTVIPEHRPTTATVLADVVFWKLWLAARFTAPNAVPVCCDANHPLPFAGKVFATVVLSDAFPYIWHKRLLADEMMRVNGPDGLIVMPHLHSALGENVSAGDTLTPRAYKGLFERQHPRLFSDTRLLADVVDHGVVDLSQEIAAEDLQTEPALTLIASRNSDLFRTHTVPELPEVVGELRVNPLYQIEYQDGSSVMTLMFPSAEYEDEFRASRKYLPATVTVKGDLRSTIPAETLDARGAELRQQRVLLDLPPGYF